MNVQLTYQISALFFCQLVAPSFAFAREQLQVFVVANDSIHIATYRKVKYIFYLLFVCCKFWELLFFATVFVAKFWRCYFLQQVLLQNFGAAGFCNRSVARLILVNTPATARIPSRGYIKKPLQKIKSRHHWGFFLQFKRATVP